MPDLRRRTCQVCHRRDSDVGPISWRGKCLACAIRLQEENAYQLAAHEGPWFQHWRTRIAASVGATIVDPPLERS